MRRRRFLLTLPLFFLLGPAGSHAFAKGIPIPIIWGEGEEVVECGELPKDVRDQLAKELGSQVKVGFLYNRFHIYYADLWTWNGRYVLYADNQYWEPQDGQWKMILGELPADKYSKPFLYGIPLGWIIIGSVIGAVVVGSRLQGRKRRQLEKLFNDSRYTEALGTAFRDKEGSPINTRYEERDFQEAVGKLRAMGIPPGKAEANLRKMADAVAAARNAEVDQALQAAASLKEQGEHEQSRAVLEHLSRVISPSDPRYEGITQSLAALPPPDAGAGQPVDEEPGAKPPAG